MCALACALALLLAQAALADVRSFWLRHVGGTQGLIQNTISALFQDDEGFVWVGTQGGMHRYDGQEFKSFTHTPSDPTSLPDNFVTAIEQGAHGTIWVGTGGAYVARLQLATGKFEHLLPKELDQPGEPGKRVLALLYDPGHGLWVASDGGIDLVDPSNGIRRSVLRRPMPAPLRTGSAFARDRTGAVWATLPSGLYRIDPTTLAVRRISTPTPASSIASDRQGQLWVSADGLYRVDLKSATLMPVVLGGANPQAENLQRIAVDKRGRLWISTLHEGLLRFDPTDGTTLSVRAKATQDAGLPEDEIDTLMVDRQGLLWVGTFTDGLAITDPDGSRFALITDPNSAQTRRMANSVRALWQSSDGALWIGTDGGGVKRYDIAQDRYTSYNDALRAAMPADMSTAAIQVRAIQGAGDGSLWIATDAGLYRLDPALGRAHALYFDDAATADKPTAPLSIVALADAGNRELWVGTQNHGLYRLDANGRTDLHIQAGGSGLSNGTVVSLHADGAGGMWIGTLDGLDWRQANGRIRHFRSDASNTATLSGNRIRAIVAGRDGAVWIGTQSGLNRVRIDGHGQAHIRRFDLGANHGSDTVYGVVEDARGFIWASSNRGVMRLDPNTDATRRYTLADGLQSLEFNGGAFATLADGRIAFGGIDGLNLFDPAHIVDSRIAPPIRLTGAAIGASTDNLAALVAPAALRLSTDDRVLRLRFSALDYANPQAIAYRYRLEGFDRDWIAAGNRSDATYTNLDPGRYLFRVQASNHDGVWGEHELRVPVRVVPPWWASAPAKAAYLALALIVAFLAWRIVQRRRQLKIAHHRDIQRREQRLQMALWGSGDEFWDLDLSDSTMRFSTSSQSGRHGTSAPIPLAAWRKRALHPDDADAVEDLLDRHLRGDTDHFESQHRVHQRGTDAWRTMLVRGKVVERSADGKPLRVAGTARDVTHKQREQRERAIAAEVLGSMSEAVCVIDTGFHIVSVNRAFTLMAGYDEAEILGHDPSLLDSLQHPPEFHQQMRRTLEITGHWSGEMWQRRKDGEEFLCAIEAAEVLEPDGRRGHFVVVLNDITERKRAEQELRYLANFDTLTGLPNRALLSERLARAIVRARRQDTLVAVLFLDLDRFKEINDSLGHSAGDRILKAVAAHLQASTRPTDTISRLGGDEFTVVVEDIVSEEGAYETARNILAAFSRPLVVDERTEVSITPSIGISLYPAHGLAPTDLLKRSDTAMYQAKALGRNTYLAYTDTMEIQARQRANITAALRRALDRNEFQLLFQPRLALARGRISGVEALIRWHSTELGEMMPSDFIPIAEETGMIVHIGEWALREACKTLAIWQADGLTDVRIAVNVSVLQLLRTNLPQLIGEILAQSGAPAACLELELTETMIMANAAETRSVFDQLRDMGLSIAIDDFGTGYSSLVYLKQLPIDLLKIDKEFVSEVTTDPDDEAITTTIINMAHSLGLTVIAEGVETQEQLDFLREHACDEIQGYWVSQPLSERHARTFIHSWHLTKPRLDDDITDDITAPTPN